MAPSAKQTVGAAIASVCAFSARSKAVLGGTALLGLVAAIPAYLAYRAYRVERAVYLPQPHPVEPNREEVGIEGLEAVSFLRADSATIAGWYAPSTNGAGVVLTHGSMSDRRSMVAEARALSAAGFGVLLFDWPGHGESEGIIQIGASEMGALESAIDFLTARADIDPGRIGGVGVSIGGYLLAAALAADARLRAAVLVGAPAGIRSQTLWEYRRWGALTQYPALFAQRRSGVPLDAPSAVELLSKSNCRILVIAGTEDPIIPPGAPHQLAAACGATGELWLIPGAGHGDFAEFVPTQYPGRIVEYFQRVLSVKGAK